MIGDVLADDAHVHAARLPTSPKQSEDHGPLRVAPARPSTTTEGTLVLGASTHKGRPREGVDVAILFCEYSPKSTGIRPVEDLSSDPLASTTPSASAWMANLNPHLHYYLLVNQKRQDRLRRRP